MQITRCAPRADCFLYFTTPFRSEKDWPGMLKPAKVSNEIFSHTDVLPTLLAAAGESDIVEKLKKGYKAGNKTFKVHVDGYNLLPLFKGETKENPRKRGASSRDRSSYRNCSISSLSRSTSLAKSVSSDVAAGICSATW
jgi:hypothetical protein